MAQKQTAQDAVSAAMSAIEDALNLSGGENHAGGAEHPVAAPDSGPAPAKASPAAPASTAPLKAPSAQESGEPPFARRLAPPSDEAKPALGAATPPANDDRPAIGPIVQALQLRRPSQAPFVTAAVAALVWLALCVAYAVLHYPTTAGSGLAAARDYALQPETVLLALAALAPAIFLFGFAALARRLQELRLSAGSIAQVALRLAEPETIAGEQVVTLSQAIRREITSMGDGIERALARAAELETLVRSEVSTLERAYSDNERRIRSLIAEMADQREAIVANGGRLRAAVDDAHKELAADLENIAQTLGERISNVGERVATSLGASSEEIAIAMDSAGSTAVDRIAAQGAQMHESLTALGAEVATRIADASNRSADEIIARVADIDQRVKDSGTQTAEAIQLHAEAAATRLIVASESLARDFGERSDDLVDRFDSSRRVLTESVFGYGDELAARLGEAAERLHETIVVRGQALEGALGGTSERLAATLSAATDDARAVFDAAGATWSEHFEARNAQLRGFFDESAGALSGQIEESAQRAVEAIINQGATAEARLQEVSQAAVARWNEQVAQSGEKFASIAGEAVASIAVSGDSMHDTLASTIATFEETLGSRGGALVTALSGQTRQLDEQLNSLAGLVGDGGDSVVERIGAHATRLGENFSAQVEAIDSIMSNRQAELDTRLADHRARFEEASNARLAEFENASVAHQTVVELALSTHAGAVNDSVREGLTKFETAFTERGNEIAKSLEGLLERIDNGLAARGKALNESLARSTIEAAKTLSEGEREITQGIGAKSAEIEESMRARAEAVTETLSNLSTEIAATLSGKLDDLTSALGGGVDRFHDRVVAPLQALSTQFDATIDSQGAAIHESIANAANELAARLSAQQDAIASWLTSAIESVDAALTGRGEDIAGSLAARIEELRTLMEGPGADFVTQLGLSGEQISNQIASVSEHAARTFEQQTSSLIGLMTRRGEDLLAAINSGATDPVRSLGALIGQLSAEVEQSGAALREAVERNAGTSVTALAAAGDRLRNELSQVLDRLGQASVALDRVVGGAGEKLGAIQGDLGEKIDEMQRALGAMAAQVSELDRLSSTTQSDSGVLIERMATYTTVLAEVSHDLAAKQQTIDLALQHRQESLQNLFADIDAKSQEFDAMTRDFTASFEESFSKAQARAQEISSALTMATKGTAMTVANQFEMIRENAGKERERTAQTLQATYEQANAQLSEVMNSTAERFRQSVAEVKQMAGEVQRHLDATRQELRRGVFELPEETNEAASAMRRVVSDQIKALKELTAVVAASGADFDVTEPAAAPARFESARNAGTSRIADAPRDDDGRLRIAPPIAAEPPRPAAAPPRPRAAQAPASAPPAPPPIAPSPAERNQSGWLSNLLAAASRDEASQAPGRAANLASKETLGGISPDIAKYVDTEAAAEMWDRWRSGDTTAVSRRLYTAQGQQTFDDIRRRYRNDPQFQASVTRYTQEFERLLAKVGQSDRDGAQSRATLLSDAGKVYTMLAHASGRLG